MDPVNQQLFDWLKDTGVSEPVVNRAMEVFETFQVATERRFACPSACVNSEDDYTWIGWDDGVHHLSCDIHGDLVAEWFWRDRTDESFGGEDQERDVVPVEVVEFAGKLQV